MSSVGEISVGVSCDPSEFTSGMTKVREELNTTTTSITVQDQSWKSFSSSVVGSLARVAIPIIQLVNTYKKLQLATLALAAAKTVAIPPTLTRASAMAFLLSPVVLITAALALAVGAFLYFTSGSEEAAASTDAAGEAAATATPKVGAMTSAWAAFKAGLVTEEASVKIAAINSEVGTLTTTLGGIKDSLVQPFVDGGNAMIGYLASLVPVDAGATMIGSALKGVNGYVSSLAERIDAGKMSWLAYGAVMLGGMNQADAEAFVSQGTAITAAAEATDKLTAKLEAQRAGFASLRDIQESASTAAANSAEVAKVSTLKTVEAIDQSIAALREKSAAEIANGATVEQLEGQTKSLFEALAKQRQGVIDGTIVDQAAIDAKKALAKATEDAAKAAANAAEKEQQKTLSGLAKITAMKDQIDLMNGSATNAEVAMREMWRAGFSQEQIDEVGALTNELDRLKEEEKDSKKKPDKVAKSGPSALKAAFQGSSEAASIMLRGVGGGKSIEDIAGKQLTVAQQQLAATKANKPQPMTAIAEFGVGA
jgi:flagellar basal body-associated protein FliL